MTAIQPARPDGLPTPHVWYDHDGSPDCPLPVGTGYIVRYSDGLTSTLRYVRQFTSFAGVAGYCVHSYPEKPE